MARVKKSEEMLKVNISARIDRDLRAQLEELAAEKKWTISQYIEIALTQHVDALSPKPAKRLPRKSAP